MCLQTEPAVALEECILSILVAVARHSPTCASAIWKCDRLVPTIVNKFTMKDAPELQASKIKSVTLLRVSISSLIFWFLSGCVLGWQKEIEYFI